MVTRAVRLAFAALLVGGGLTLTASPAGALSPSYRTALFVSPTSPKATIFVGGLRADITLPQPTRVVLMGRFDESTLTETAFLYNPGPRGDGVLSWKVEEGKIVTSFTPMAVGGEYRPFVLDYDNTGPDDIFWYAPGTRADYVWTFTDEGTHGTVNEDVDGDYLPIFIPKTLYADSLWSSQGIIWYGPGTSPDVMWSYVQKSAELAVWEKQATTINGHYRPVVGDLRDTYKNRVDILWYAPNGPEYLWTMNFDIRNPISERVAPDMGPGARPIVGSYRTSSVDDEYPFDPADILWYTPGPARERYWVLDSASNEPPTYTSWPAGSILGDYRTMPWGGGDVWFLNDGTSAQLVHFGATGPSGSLTVTGLPPEPRGGTGAIVVQGGL